MRPRSTVWWVRGATSGLEERALTIAYPDYPEYARRVEKRFVPFVV